MVDLVERVPLQIACNSVHAALPTHLEGLSHAMVDLVERHRPPGVLVLLPPHAVFNALSTRRRSRFRSFAVAGCSRKNFRRRRRRRCGRRGPLGSVGSGGVNCRKRTRHGGGASAGPA
eukprot:361723-Chlamydomonas_euryale.AAC.6